MVMESFNLSQHGKTDNDDDDDDDRAYLKKIDLYY